MTLYIMRAKQPADFLTKQATINTMSVYTIDTIGRHASKKEKAIHRFNQSVDSPANSFERIRKEGGPIYMSINEQLNDYISLNMKEKVLSAVLPEPALPPGHHG